MAPTASSPRPSTQDRGVPAPGDIQPIPPGLYRNPVLDEDWPDPDVIRFGDEYLMVASSFNRAPGLPVLRSADLVTWQVAAHALPAVPPHQHFALPRHGSGVWAPSIRAHQDTLYISVDDDGVGGAAEHRGTGLIGLRQRVESIDGSLQIRSQPTKGTTIEVELPCEL